jgi:hypothetical protein
MESQNHNLLKQTKERIQHQVPACAAGCGLANAQSRRNFLIMASGLLATAQIATATSPAKLLFACSPENDLFQALGKSMQRFDSGSAAIRAAEVGAGVLILADDYPLQCTYLDERMIEEARQKHLRLYVEFPAWLPGQTLPPPLTAHWERAVISSAWFGPKLAPLRLLNINDCHYVPVSGPQADIVLARVAGFQTAVYGIPENDAHPILFRQSEFLMVATTRLSQFLTARYCPAEAWIAVWERVIGWLCGMQDVAALHARPTVHPSFAAGAPMPAGTEETAFRRGVAWYSKARMLVHPDWQSRFAEAVQFPDRVGPAPKLDWPAGDGSCGMMEGFSSSIDQSGSQPTRWIVRSDCTGESSFAFALADRLRVAGRNREIATNLNDFIYRNPSLSGLSRANPASPSFGLLNWDTASKGVYYADDNARSFLGTIGAAAALRSNRWDQQILSCILGNFRTTGPLGFRGNTISEAELQKNGWRHYFELERTHYAPHYEAYPWAAYLWAYDKTRYRLFLDRTITAISKTMAAYPQQWRWTNGMQQERARMLLPLAWLVRVQDTAEHRRWLELVARDLLRCQDSSGAIREEIGIAGNGSYAPPASNQAYGTTEAPLIQQNGDPACDLLYTSNFAFLGLHEAAAATGEQLYADAENKLAAFLCRIQVRSTTHPELDGAWFRAFDYQLWDYWASNADAGWGVWSIETGWTQAWITSTLAMRSMRTSLWDLSAKSRIDDWTHNLLSQFSLDDQ